MPEDRAVQEDVLAARQLRMEPGADLEQRADAAAQARPRRSVGGVTRERTFSSVLLPAPLGPMIPNVSPRLDLEETSRSAQNSSRALRRRRPSAAGAAVSVSLSSR